MSSTALCPLVAGPQRLLHGGDYNPEQWQHRDDILAADPQLMRSAGINHASLAIFGWAAIEPSPGTFTFGWLDRAMDRLHAAGIGVLLATPTAARPRWLASMHPDVMRVRADGVRVQPGFARHNQCLSSPVFRERAVDVIHRLGERYHRHPALLGWHIDNEFGGDGEDRARCHCERCIARFQGWLQERFRGDLAALNLAWWTSFWSHQFQSWDQIRPGDRSLEAVELNWRRFCSWQMVDFCAAEIAAVRRWSPLPATTNFWGDLRQFDAGAMARHLDWTSYDSYPAIHERPGDIEEIAEQAWVVDAVRSHKPDRPWLLMESCPSIPQWHAPMRLKRTGAHRCLSLSMVAQGSDGVCYFQWRAGRGGQEKYHGSVLAQDGPTDTRVFREVAGLGRELAGLAGVAGSAVESRIAVLWDVECEWARQASNGMHNLPSPAQLSRSWHRVLWEVGYTLDVVDATADLARYLLIVVPGIFLLRPGFAARVEAAARAGALVLVDALSAWVDDELACVEGGRPGPLRHALGFTAEELDHLNPDERLDLADPDGWLAAGARVEGWMDRIHPATAEVVVRARGGFHDGWPVLTRHACGAGSCWYLAGGLDAASRLHLLDRLARLAAVAPCLPTRTPGVVVRERRQPDATWLFLMRYGVGEAEVALDGRAWRDALSGEPVADSIRLGDWGARVLVTGRADPGGKP